MPIPKRRKGESLEEWRSRIISLETRAGKPPKQAQAIGYSVTGTAREEKAMLTVGITKQQPERWATIRGKRVPLSPKGPSRKPKQPAWGGPHRKASDMMLQLAQDKFATARLSGSDETQGAAPYREIGRLLEGWGVKAGAAKTRSDLEAVRGEAQKEMDRITSEGRWDAAQHDMAAWTAANDAVGCIRLELEGKTLGGTT